MPIEGYSWATGGYLGAIRSGQTTCGLLIGCSTAIGLRCGNGKTGRPEEVKEARDTAVKAVGQLYGDFIKKFGATECKTISTTDFSDPDDIRRFREEAVWKGRCDVYLRFVMEKCREMADQGII